VDAEPRLTPRRRADAAPPPPAAPQARLFYPTTVLFFLMTVTRPLIFLYRVHLLRDHGPAGSFDSASFKAPREEDDPDAHGDGDSDADGDADGDGERAGLAREMKEADLEAPWPSNGAKAPSGPWALARARADLGFC
jgi:hypothetical protein